MAETMHTTTTGSPADDETSSYFFVILKGGANAASHKFHAAEHEDFITSLIKSNRILLGGAFAEPVGDAYAAYVLRCHDIIGAREIAAQGPLCQT
jgi:hypothetical protein